MLNEYLVFVSKKFSLDSIVKPSAQSTHQNGIRKCTVHCMHCEHKKKNFRMHPRSVFKDQIHNARTEPSSNFMQHTVRVCIFMKCVHCEKF